MKLSPICKKVKYLNEAISGAMEPVREFLNKCKPFIDLHSFILESKLPVSPKLTSVPIVPPERCIQNESLLKRSADSYQHIDKTYNT